MLLIVAVLTATVAFLFFSETAVAVTGRDYIGSHFSSYMTATEVNRVCTNAREKLARLKVAREVLVKQLETISKTEIEVKGIVGNSLGTIEAPVSEKEAKFICALSEKYVFSKALDTYLGKQLSILKIKNAMTSISSTKKRMVMIAPTKREEAQTKILQLESIMKNEVVEARKLIHSLFNTLSIVRDSLKVSLSEADNNIVALEKASAIFGGEACNE